MKSRYQIICTLGILILLTGCSKHSDLQKVKLTEVAHSIFYAPQYVAIEEGYFEEEGLEIVLTNGLGADKTMTAVLSGDADIGFMGSEASIYVYSQGAEDYAVNFAQLTQRAGNFLVSRQEEKEFRWKDLEGKTVIGGRAGGMPQMVFEYILKKNGMNPQEDLKIIQNIDFGLTAEAFASGEGDYTIEFEPSAQALEKDKKGVVVASLGVESGMVPYTGYAAKKSYLEENSETIQKFVNAIHKGMEYVNAHTPEEIAKVIKPQFPETDMDDVIQIVDRYYQQDTWKNDTIFHEDSFNLLQNILIEAGELEKNVPYEDLVTTEYSIKAEEE